MNTLPHKTIRFLLSIFFLFILLSGHFEPLGIDAATVENAVIFYVSPHGNDQWSGTIAEVDAKGTDGPFATLQRARNAVRGLRQRGSNRQFTILVRGGTYRLDKTLTLEPEDSGTESNPFTIRAYDNEQPILSGAIPVSGFTAHKGEILRAALKGTSLEAYSFRQLFAKGKRQILARFPNFDPIDPIGRGFLYAEEAVKGGSQVKFKFNEGSIHDWAKTSNAEIFIYPGYNYWNNTIPVAEIDREQRIITLAGKASYPITAGNRYYFQNVLEELDSPGEWYFDQKEKALYYWPVDAVSLGTVTIPILKSILEIKGKKVGNKYYGTPSNIRFEGFTLEGCEGSAIVVNGAKSTVIAGNTIYNAGSHGIEIQDGFENAAFGNDIYEVGGEGIKISGGNRKTLTPANNRAENNYIHHIGIFLKASSGINCEGVGNVISHNLIHSTPRVGIWFDGNDHLIEYNHIHNVNQETQDSGVIYSCARDWTKRGNVVQFNYLHDSGGYGRNSTTGVWQVPFDTYGIYMDDWSSGTKVYGNIVTNTANGGIFIHAGRDNIVENNVIIEGGRLGQMVYSAWLPSHPSAQKLLPVMYAKIREMGYTKYPLLSTITDIATGAKMSGNSFVRNIVYYTGQSAVLYCIYNDIDLATTLSDYNIIYHAGLPLLVPFTKVAADLQWTKWKDSGLDRNSIIADPLFTDIAKGNFSLLPNSPALKMGFKPIPFEKIGPYKDPLRASWPLPLQDIKAHQIPVN